jgi:hypothetical protein
VKQTGETGREGIPSTVFPLRLSFSRAFGLKKSVPGHIKGVAGDLKEGFHSALGTSLLGDEVLDIINRRGWKLKSK